MAAPQTVLELIERFDRNRVAYRSEQYNEARLRIEFLNPLFEALGCATKAPDYCFRVGGTRKFFVEAKNRQSI